MDDMIEDMENDPNIKKYKLLQEQLEFWKERFYDNTLDKEQKIRAETKYAEIMKESISHLEKFNRYWDEVAGPLPHLDDEALNHIRKQFAEKGIEVTADELKELLEEDKDDY